MLKFVLILLLFLSLAAAQTPDPLGRETPQNSVVHFLEACHSRDYDKALHYLDLRQIPADKRSKEGPNLARQLEDLLDDTPFSITTLSRDPNGAESDGSLPAYEALDTVRVDGRTLNMRLIRVELKPGLRVWIVSADTVSMIPEAHQLVAETPFEKSLPQFLVTVELFDTPIWRWIALLASVVGLWFLAGLIAWSVARPFPLAKGFRNPLRVFLAVTGFGAVLHFVPPSVLADFYISRGMGMLFCLSLAWAASALVDLIAHRWHSKLDPRVSVMSYSVLPLGMQILKLALFMFAVLLVLDFWGYNTSTILAGLGVGGLAVALAAQKTIENLFGGISVIGDRPVLVGDTCRFGDRTGTIMHIGLRSTRIRTPERTVISVPNAQFSSMPLENISGRDKIYFHHTLRLRRDATAAQVSAVIASVNEILAAHKDVETGKTAVRLIGMGEYSLDLEIAAYVATHEYEDFLVVQQELLLAILQAVERAGTRLAVPLQESVTSSPGPQ